MHRFAPPCSSGSLPPPHRSSRAPTSPGSTPGSGPRPAGAARAAVTLGRLGAARRLGLLSLALLMGMAGSAGAAPAWVGPDEVAARPASSSSPTVAMAPDGTSVSAFTQAEFTGLQTVGWSLLTTTRAPDVTGWSAPQPVVHETDPLGVLSSPRLVITPSGVEVVFWERGTNGVVSLVAAERAGPAAPWGPPRELSPPGPPRSLADIAVGPGGDVIAAWRITDIGVTTTIRAAVRAAATGDWRVEEVASLPALQPVAAGPAAGVAADGTATVAWIPFSGGGSPSAATRPPGGAWGPAVPVGTPTAGVSEALSPLVVTSGPGATATILWRTTLSGSFAYRVLSASRPSAAGAWGPARPVDAGDGSVPKSVGIAAGPSGEEVALWTAAGLGVFTVVRTARRPAGGDWGPVQDLSPQSVWGFVAVVAVGADGDMLAAWSEGGGPGEQRYPVSAARRAPGGAFGPVADLSGPVVGFANRSVAAALGPRGRGVAVWGAYWASGSAQCSATYDLDPAPRPAPSPSTATCPRSAPTSGPPAPTSAGLARRGTPPPVLRVVSVRRVCRSRVCRLVVTVVLRRAGRVRVMAGRRTLLSVRLPAGRRRLSVPLPSGARRLRVAVDGRAAGTLVVPVARRR